MEAPKKKTSLVIPILILIILIGVVILSQRKPPELSIKEQAWGACELLIPKKLKAPSTAKFERYNENQVRMLSDTEYSVTIAVDAKTALEQ